MAECGKNRVLLYLFLLWFIYLMVGMFIFRAVELDDKPDPEQSKPQLLENIKDNITAKYNMSEAEFDSIVKQVEAASLASSDGPEWSYRESISFVVQLVTTIGYGNITPVTTGGRAFCIIFALFGIPINILFLQVVGERMLRSERLLVTKFESRCLKRESKPRHLNEKCAFLGLMLLIIILLVGAATAVKVQEWTFFEGFYAYFITFTTVGFGDLIPGGGPSKHPVWNTVIRIIFIILGLAAMSNVINGLVSARDCKECKEFFKNLKARLGRKQRGKNPETMEKMGMEINEQTEKPF